MSIQACTINATLQLAKVHTNSVKLHPWKSLEYLNQFQYIPHNYFITTYNSFYVFSEKHLMFSTQTHENAIFPHKVRGEKVWEPKGELIRLSDVIFQRPTNDPTDLEFLNQKTFHRLPTSKNI